MLFKKIINVYSKNHMKAIRHSMFNTKSCWILEYTMYKLGFKRLIPFKKLLELYPKMNKSHLPPKSPCPFIIYNRPIHNNPNISAIRNHLSRIRSSKMSCHIFQCVTYANTRPGFAVPSTSVLLYIHREHVFDQLTASYTNGGCFSFISMPIFLGST